jgi:hypothetical protein
MQARETRVSGITRPLWYDEAVPFTPMPSSPDAFPELFSQSVEVSKRLWRPVVIGGLMFCLMLLVSVLLAIFGLMVAGPVNFNGGSIDSLGSNAIAGFAVVIVFVTLIIFIGWAANTYYQVLAVKRSMEIRKAALQVLPLMLPLAYTGVWMFLRTYSWVPLIALLVLMLLFQGDPNMMITMMMLGVAAMIGCTAYFTPRVLFAPFILVSEGKQPNESVTLSMQRTKGYFWKILGNFVLLMIIVSALSFGLQTLFGALFQVLFAHVSDTSPIFTNIFGIAAGIVAFAVFMILYALLKFVPLVFLTQLHATLKKHPRG